MHLHLNSNPQCLKPRGENRSGFGILRDNYRQGCLLCHLPPISALSLPFAEGQLCSRFIFIPSTPIPLCAPGVGSLYTHPYIDILALTIHKLGMANKIHLTCQLWSIKSDCLKNCNEQVSGSLHGLVDKSISWLIMSAIVTGDGVVACIPHLCYFCPGFWEYYCTTTGMSFVSI